MDKKEVFFTAFAMFLFGIGIGFNGGIHIEVPAFLPQIFLVAALICCAIVGVISKKRKNKQD